MTQNPGNNLYELFKLPFLLAQVEFGMLFSLIYILSRTKGNTGGCESRFTAEAQQVYELINGSGLTCSFNIHLVTDGCQNILKVSYHDVFVLRYWKHFSETFVCQPAAEPKTSSNLETKSKNSSNQPHFLKLPHLHWSSQTRLYKYTDKHTYTHIDSVDGDKMRDY